MGQKVPASRGLPEQRRRAGNAWQADGPITARQPDVTSTTLAASSVRCPDESGTRTWVCRHEDACPSNVRFACGLPDDSPHRARAAIAGKDARTLGGRSLGLTRETSRARSASRRQSARSCAARSATPSWCSATSARLTTYRCSRALGGSALLVREHAAWALRRLGPGRHCALAQLIRYRRADVGRHPASAQAWSCPACALLRSRPVPTLPPTPAALAAPLRGPPDPATSSSLDARAAASAGMRC